MSDAAREHREGEEPENDVRPDWLVSSEQIEHKKSEDLDADLPPLPQQIQYRNSIPPPRSTAPPEPVGPKAWTGAASSVPTLKIERKPRSRQDARNAEPVALPRALDPDDREEDDEQELHSLSTFSDDAAPEAAPRMAPAHKPRHEPFWVIALDTLRSEPKVQLLVLAVVLLTILGITLWPRSEPGVSLAAIKRDPSRWDAQRVRVHGKVGDVFRLGGGYAYYLHQGRDTMVVFTRGDRPRSRRPIEVVGNVSTGFLDGAPRQAIFEDPSAKN